MKRILFVLAVTIMVSAQVRSQNFNQAKLDSLINLIESNDRGMGSISLFKDGKEIYSRAYGYADMDNKIKNNTSTRFRVGSISKTFTATIIMKLIDNKQLSLDTKLSRFYPELENADQITIEHLLQHRSGIYNLTNAEDYETSWHKIYFSKKTLLEKIASKKNVFDPGTKTEYSNSNYILLTFIVEDITKKDFAAVLNEWIIRPCGLTNTSMGGKINTQKNEALSYNKLSGNTWNKSTETDMSIPLGAGAIVSTPTDLNTFYYALMNGKLISEASLNQMKTFKDNFGLGLFPVPFFNRQGVGHSGGIDGFQSFAAYYPNEQLNIAFTANAVQYPVNTITGSALSVYFNQPFTLPVFTQALELSEDEMKQYIGTYAAPNFPMKITVFTKDKTLMAQATGQSAFPLECFEKDKFKFDAAALKLFFKPSENKMTLQQGGREFVLTKE